MRAATGLLLGICLLSLIACGGKKKHYYTDDGLSNVHPFVSGSPYSAVLKRCATAADQQSCTLEELPVLGMETLEPTVEDVMSRVLVSHPWMGKRLEQVLNEMPEDLLKLFRSITVVVVDDDIRPSFYRFGTAAIYLDPEYLWLLDEERATISDKEDFRGEYIRQMNYRPVWRYISGSEYSARSLDTIVMDTAQLLFHELAHATDRFPPVHFQSVDRSWQIHQVVASLKDVSISRLLNASYPLESEVMFDLASILYGGAVATPSYKAMTAAEVGHQFASDGANDDYNYALLEEDVAMLFEEAMMKFHFNLDRDVGFTSATDSIYCQDYILGWGMRNRLGVEKIKTRAQWVVEQLLPESDYSLDFDTFPEPRQLRTEVSWCDSDTSSQSAREKSFASGFDERLINPRDLLPSGGRELRQ